MAQIKIALELDNNEMAYMSFLIGSCTGVVFLFLSTFRCERPFLRRRNDSRNDFLKDFRRDIGLSSALAMSANQNENVININAISHAFVTIFC